MPELRKDPIVGRWVIISTERARRPSDFATEPVRPTGGDCPFCPGNEPRTPPEIVAGRPTDSGPNQPGWSYRVIPNMFPALRIEGELDPSGEGLFDRMNGVGAHEVVIETADHRATLATLSTDALADVLLAFRERLLEHPHSQLIATPIIPVMVAEELAGSARYYAMKERCVWCDILRQERREGRRRIVEANGFVALAPFAPRFPFETWILPVAHGAAYEDSGVDQLRGLAGLLGEFLRRMNRTLGDPPFNFMLHTAPLHETQRDSFHWHLEIIPKLTRVAGFEWGSGFFINAVPPEDAAEALRADGG